MISRLALLSMSIAACLALFFPAAPQAEGINLTADLLYNQTSEETTNKTTGAVTDTDSDRFRQLYNLVLDKEIYPYLSAGGGGIFELVERGMDTEGVKTENRDRTIRPFAELNLTNPLYRGGLSYRSAQIRSSGDNITTTTNNLQEYSGLLNWRPQDLPSLNLNVTRTLIHDDPLTRDSVNELFNLRTKYNYHDLQVDYGYNQTDMTEKLANSSTMTKTHNGGLRFSPSLFDNRLSLDTGARLNMTTIEFSGAGQAQIQTTVLGSEFFILNNTSPLSNLASDIHHAPASAVNIGRNGGPNQVSVGLEFETATEVDTLYILLVANASDPTLASPAEIASINLTLFDFELYTSDDQLTWIPVAVPIPAANVRYNQFDNRFELSFAKIETRFFKVRITPLPQTATVTGDIKLANLKAFTTVTGAQTPKFETLNQIYNLAAQWAFSENTTGGYDFYFRNIDTRPADSRRSSLTNGVFLRHRIDPVFGLNTRVLRTTIQETGKSDTLNYSYTASLRADYLQTFNQSLIYSGTSTEEQKGNGSTNTIFLRNNADLYTGLSTFLDTGYSWNKPPAKGDQTSIFVRAGTNVVPNKAININFDYAVSWDTDEGIGDSTSQVGGVRTLWVITETINVFVNYDWRDKRGAEKDSTSLLDYAINWSPFPDGSLRFSLNYSETIATEGEQSKFFTPGLRWQIARSMFVDLRYSQGTEESETEKSDIKTVTANFRVFY